MGFDSLRFYNFRNLLNQEIPVSQRQVFFIGENGQGKSNFLEAVYLCCYGKSFRTKKDADLIKFNESEMSIQAHYSYPQDINRNHTIKIKIQDKKKSIFIDDQAISNRKELFDNFPCIIFCHDDIEYVRGGPEYQRAFFDQSASLTYPEYLGDYQFYIKTLKTRNLLLKEKKLELLSTYDHQLLEYGLRLIKKREAIQRLFNQYFSPLYSSVSGSNDTVSIHYKPSWKSSDFQEILKHLVGNREREISMGTSLSGPHRDKFVFMNGDRDFFNSASTGQFRLMSLLLRLIQAKILYQKYDQNMTLLIDDVLLELDPVKRKRFLDHLPSGAQAFYTFLPGESVSRLSGEDVMKYEVKEGNFHEKSF